MNLIVEKKLRNFRKQCLKRGYPEPLTDFDITFIQFAGQNRPLTERERKQSEGSPVKDNSMYKIKINVGNEVRRENALRGFQIPGAVDDILDSISKNHFPLKAK